VHVNTLHALPEAAVARSTGSPVLLHVHEMLGGRPRHVVAGRLAGWSADLVMAVSRSSAAALSRHGTATVVVPNGVAAPASPLRRPQGNGRLVVGTLGTVSRRKGSDLFLAAARLVQREEPRVEFRMVGPLASGPEERWARNLVSSARGQGVAYSTVSDAFEELPKWDLFVLPSREDPFPLAVLEAMASRLPTVATCVDGIPEQVGTDAAVLVRPEDPSALAEAILGLLRAPQRREALAAAARRRVEERYTLERQAQGVHDAYVRTIDRGSRRGRGHSAASSALATGAPT
jgi:glycosyltransferase involved in cell wall biosynthesis